MKSGSGYFGSMILQRVWGIGLLLFAMAAGAQSQTKPADGMNDANKLVVSPKRDPFWPVGYEPENFAAAKEEPEVRVSKSTAGNNWNGAMKKVVINGVSSRANNDFYAVINGSVKSVGDTVSVEHEGNTYTWAVDRIDPPGSVKLRRVSAK